LTARGASIGEELRDAAEVQMIRSMRVSSNVTMALLLALGSPFSSGVTQRVSSAPVAITSVTVLPMDRGHMIAGQTVVIVERAVVEQKRAG